MYGGEGGGYCHVSQIYERQQFEVVKGDFWLECLTIFATGCSDCYQVSFAQITSSWFVMSWDRVQRTELNDHLCCHSITVKVTLTLIIIYHFGG